MFPTMSNAPRADTQAIRDPVATATPALAVLQSVVPLSGPGSGVPMTAAEVCEPRSVSLTQSSSRLNRDARRHLINAADHASVCEMQRVVIRAPDGRADVARETLLAHGVDDAMITVEQSDAGLGVEMQFAGVATSSEQYAAMYNGVQTAALAPAPEAPPFRTLSRNYRVDTLEEALAEGISVGHPAMPQFQFPPEDVNALVTYLQSVQERPSSR